MCTQKLSADLGEEHRHTPIAARSTLDLIIDYECGNLSDDDTLDLFQRLVDSGQAWSLQGHYGRTAQRLIEGGYING